MNDFNLESAAPQPLAPLTHTIISPANIEAEQRRAAAQRLSLKQRWMMWRALRKLTKQIAQLEAKQKAQLGLMSSLRPKMSELYTRYLNLKEQLAETPEDETLKQEYLDLWAELTPIKSRWDALQRQIAPLQRLRQQKSRIQRALEDHTISVEREKTEMRLMKAMRKEAQIYEKLIVDKWTRLGFCERYTKGSKEYVKTVDFSEIHLTLDAIFFKIDASFQTAFKNWKTNLPAGVYIVEQLLNPKTLDELSITCQRQVTGLHSAGGAWVVVHRLNSTDGLMNYVAYQDVMERYPAKFSDRLPICVGVGMNRQIQWVNLADFPHWLVGGYTNSGKSNMINVGICTLISKHQPKDLRLVLIDLKGGLEFNFYENIPHLHGSIVDSVGEVAATIGGLESEMAARFKKFRSKKAKTIEFYNSAVKEDDRLPRILCVFDEVASILEHGEATKEIMSSLRQLVAKGRAVGIHVWLCTQRPDVKVVEGAVKANLSLRLTGRLPSSADSVTILGNSMAKDLAAIPGRMVLQISPDPQQVQTPHINDSDIAAAIEAARQMPAAPALEVSNIRIVHQEWTVERVIELSIKHLDGNLSANAVWKSADDLSKGQAQKLVEQIWRMPEISYDGRQYKVVLGKGKIKSLVPLNEAERVAS
jgi:hypothetical protein